MPGNARGELLFGTPMPVASLNTPFADVARGISGDGLTIYLSSLRPNPPETASTQSDLWVSMRSTTADAWNEPTPIAELNTPAGEFHPFVTPDELTLLYGGPNDVFISTRASKADMWGPAAPLPAPVSSAEGDDAPFMSADRLTLLFDSNRPGGQGDTDLWMATRPTIGGDWTVSNLGAVINTAAQERGPYLSSDSLNLFFASRRSGGLGDFDLYVSRRDEPTAPWGPPLNLGPQINTPLNENFPMFWDAGNTLFFRSHGLASPQGQADILQVRVIAEPSTGMLTLGGVALVGGCLLRRRRRGGKCAALLLAPLMLLAGVDRSSTPHFNSRTASCCPQMAN